MWSPMKSNTNKILVDVWGGPAPDVFAVGAKGTILRFNGTNWTLMNTNASKSIVGIWGNSSSNVFAVGENIILHYDGIAWKPMGNVGTPHGLWGDSSSNLFAVGTGGTILRYTNC